MNSIPTLGQSVMNEISRIGTDCSRQQNIARDWVSPNPGKCSLYLSINVDTHAAVLTAQTHVKALSWYAKVMS